MRTKLFLVLSVFLGVSPLAHAKGGMIMRGGQGFLFPDHNSTINAGQWALASGVGVEAMYTRSTTGTSQTATPSVVYGNGRMGFGVAANRSGTDLLNNATNSIAGGLGFAMMKDVLTFGATYSQVLGTSSLGDLSAQLNFNPSGRKGFAFGLGYTRGLGSGTNSATVALGYSFMHNNTLEVDFELPALDSFSNYNVSAHFTMMKQFIYLGGGYLLVNNGTMLHGATGRLGFVLGGSLDLSFWARYFFTTGSPIEYGGTVRVAF